MKYFVVTTKHHEGFCLWDSKYTTGRRQHALAVKTCSGRCEAFRAEG